jgi:hypothetical protein
MKWLSLIFVFAVMIQATHAQNTTDNICPDLELSLVAMRKINMDLVFSTTSAARTMYYADFHGRILKDHYTFMEQLCVFQGTLEGRMNLDYYWLLMLSDYTNEFDELSKSKWGDWPLSLPDIQRAKADFDYVWSEVFKEPPQIDMSSPRLQAMLNSSCPPTPPDTDALINLYQICI